MKSNTTPMEDAIRELRGEIEATRLDLDAKVRSLRVLENILEKMNGGTVEKNSQQSNSHTVESTEHAPELIDLQELNEGFGTKKRTLADDIKDLLPKFGTQEFNIAHVEAILKRAGIEVIAKSPRSRISVALTKLCEDNVVVKTFSGAGNTPNKYRARATMTDLEIMNVLANNPKEGSEGAATTS